MQTKESFFQGVRSRCTNERFEEQKDLYNFVTNSPGLSAKHGPKDNAKSQSYVIKAGHYSVGYVQDDGLIQIYFLTHKDTNSSLPEKLREDYRRKTEEILGVKSSKSERWPVVVKRGNKFPLDKLKQLFMWIVQEVGKLNSKD